MKFIIRFGISMLMGIAVFTARGSDGAVDIRINPVAGHTITAPGVYRLVSDVTMTANVRAIVAEGVSDVTLDLNGHTITGVAGNATIGIHITGDRAIVRNGRIRGYRICLDTSAGKGAVLEDLTVEGSALSGIFAGIASRIQRCVVTNCNGNGGTGALTSSTNSIITDCTVRDTVSTVSGFSIGISVSAGSRVERNIVENVQSSNAAATGISTNSFTDCVLIGNIVRNCQSGGTSTATGILCGDAALLKDNLVVDITSAGLSRGIHTGISAQIESNKVEEITATGALEVTGIQAGSNSTLRNNTVRQVDNDGTGDALGIVASSGFIESNTCLSITEGPNANSTAFGISSASSTVRGNHCSSISASTLGGVDEGTAIGIDDSGSSVIEGNTCSSAVGRGTGNFGVGIRTTSFSTIVGNHVKSNNASGGARGYGIQLTGTANYVADNRTHVHTTAGIIFTLDANLTRSERNRYDEATGIDTVNGFAPDHTDAGDLRDITF